MESNQDIAFEPTLEERVEVTVKFLRHTADGRALRRRALWKTVFVAGLAMFVVAAAVNRMTEIKALAGLSVVVLLFGTAIAFILHQWSDWGLESRVRTSLEQRMAGNVDKKCEIQLREDGLSVRDLGVAMMLPWTDATGVAELGQSIEISFRSAIVVARERAFSSAEERQLFLRRVRALARLAAG